MDLEKIRALVKMVEESDVTGLTIEEGNTKIEIEKFAPVTQSTYVSAGPVAAAPSATISQPIAQPTTNDNAGLTAIVSPMTGTFYGAASPDTPPFVKVGDKITKGQVVCIIEAMKSFNEIESDFSGTVEKILVTNGQGVDLDQPVILIKE